jgi:ABC-type amino acid transport substrate-binding protein
MDRDRVAPLRPRRPGGRRAALGAVVGLALAAMPAAAQLLSEVDRAELDNWRIASGNVIRFCQFDVNLTNDFDRAVAEEIAARLLLESRFVMLGAGYGVDGDGIEVDVFKSLTNDCEVMLGMQVGGILYAPEFTVTRPYVSYDYMLIAAEPSYAAIEDIPRAGAIATPLASPGDLAFARWMATQGEASIWRRIPFGRPADMLDSLLAGEIEAMLMFAPVYAVLAEDRPEDAARLKVLSVADVVASPTGIGGVMLARSAFLRGEIDQAIDSMIADGTIEALLEEHGFGAIPARPGGGV